MRSLVLNNRAQLVNPVWYAMVTDKWRHLTYNSREHGINCMPSSARIKSELLSEFYTLEKCDFLKSISHFLFFI